MQATTVALRDIYCANDRCRYLLRNGKRALVTRAAPGSVVEGKCHECRTVNVYRVLGGP